MHIYIYIYAYIHIHTIVALPTIYIYGALGRRRSRRARIGSSIDTLPRGLREPREPKWP